MAFEKKMSHQALIRKVLKIVSYYLNGTFLITANPKAINQYGFKLKM